MWAGVWEDGERVRNIAYAYEKGKNNINSNGVRARFSLNFLFHTLEWMRLDMFIYPKYVPDKDNAVRGRFPFVIVEDWLMRVHFDVVQHVVAKQTIIF